MTHSELPEVTTPEREILQTAQCTLLQARAIQDADLVQLVATTNYRRRAHAVAERIRRGQLTTGGYDTTRLSA